MREASCTRDALACSGGSALSPQTRRGRAAPPSHRKPAPNPAPTAAKPAAGQPQAGKAASSGKSAAAPKSAAATRPAPEVESADDEYVAQAKPVPPKHAGKPVRRKSGLAKVRKSSAAKYGGEWVKAYAPLFAAAVIGFSALWAWISFGPHTPSPKENWTRIESEWKPKRDADLEKVSAAVASSDLTAQLAAYRSLRDDTKGWMDALTAIKSWDAPDATAAPNQTTTVVQAMGAFTADGQTIVTVLDSLLTGATENDILAQKDLLVADDQAFNADYDTVRNLITGETPAASVQPTVAFPPGTFVPSPSPGASVSAGPSAGSSASPTAAPTSTPAPAATPSPS